MNVYDKPPPPDAEGAVSFLPDQLPDQLPDRIAQAYPAPTTSTLLAPPWARAA